jgi:hypothetical protein
MLIIIAVHHHLVLPADTAMVAVAVDREVAIAEAEEVQEAVSVEEAEEVREAVLVVEAEEVQVADLAVEVVALAEQVDNYNNVFN